MLVWRDYQTDLFDLYPFVPLTMGQINATEVVSSFDPLLVLLPDDLNNIVEIKYGCKVPNLQSRQIIIYASDGGQFYLSYYRRFSSLLFQTLTNNLNVQAFEFIGERIRYSRLSKMLSRGQ